MWVIWRPHVFATVLTGGPNVFGQDAELRVERFEVVSVGLRR
jgi:hypothetical protein